jgi:hypothetical protein
MLGRVRSELIRPIVQFLHLNGLDANRIHHELEPVLGPNDMPYPAVTRALRSAIWPILTRKHLTPKSRMLLYSHLVSSLLLQWGALREGCIRRQRPYIVTSLSRFILYPNIYNRFLTT